MFEDSRTQPSQNLHQNYVGQPNEEITKVCWRTTLTVSTITVTHTPLRLPLPHLLTTPAEAASYSTTKGRPASNKSTRTMMGKDHDGTNSSSNDSDKEETKEMTMETKSLENPDQESTERTTTKKKKKKKKKEKRTTTTTGSSSLEATAETTDGSTKEAKKKTKKKSKSKSQLQLQSSMASKSEDIIHPSQEDTIEDAVEKKKRKKRKKRKKEKKEEKNDVDNPNSQKQKTKKKKKKSSITNRSEDCAIFTEDGKDEPEETETGAGDDVDNNDNGNNNKKQTFMEAASSKALRPFVIISSSYLLFTITDGAIRMIVLLHAYNKNFSALEVAIMFTLYELAGVFTNLAAGIMGARWGIKFTLICGLSLQLVSYALLFGWQDDWSKTEAIVYVTFAQMFAGVAKDLTKLGGKTVTKLVTPEEQDTKLFKLVSLITGWKNSLKGVGYFLGSALISVSYELALGVMMILIVIAMPWAICGLDRNLGTAKTKNASWSEVFDLSNHNLNWLSLARLFLFASRDFWFEVPLPFFLRSPSCEGLGEDLCMADDDCTRGAICGATSGFCENINEGGGCGGLGIDRVVVGAVLGGYIILYGQVQSWTPQLVTGPLDQTPPNKLTEILWGYINCLPTLVGWIVIAFSPSFQNYEVTAMSVWLVAIIVTFAIICKFLQRYHLYMACLSSVMF